jgi:hypothetical protein
MSSRQMEENAEAGKTRYVAEQLGITVDDLESTHWEIEPHSGNDGAEYGHYVKFSQDSPKEVLDRIVGLENNCVDITLEDDDDFYDPNDDGLGGLSDDELKLGDTIMPQIAEEERRKRDEGK